MDYVLDHTKHKSAATMTNTKQNMGYGNHEESDLKNRINILKDAFKMMSWWNIISISSR